MDSALPQLKDHRNCYWTLNGRAASVPLDFGTETTG